MEQNSISLQIQNNSSQKLNMPEVPGKRRTRKTKQKQTTTHTWRRSRNLRRQVCVGSLHFIPLKACGFDSAKMEDAGVRNMELSCLYKGIQYGSALSARHALTHIGERVPSRNDMPTADEFHFSEPELHSFRSSFLCALR